MGWAKRSAEVEVVQFLLLAARCIKASGPAKLSTVYGFFGKFVEFLISKDVGERIETENCIVRIVRKSLFDDGRKKFFFYSYYVTQINKISNCLAVTM